METEQCSQAKNTRIIQQMNNNAGRANIVDNRQNKNQGFLFGSSLQRVEDDEEDVLQGKMSGTVQRVEEEDDEVLQGKMTAPAPKNETGLPDNLKAGVESLSGFSLDNVRVHYNSSKPATVQALAYTQGTDIHVAPGQEKHLPHEAWHVAQQMAGRVSPTTNINGMPVNDNAALEHEADVMGEKALQRKPSNTPTQKGHGVEVAQRVIQRVYSEADILRTLGITGDEMLDEFRNGAHTIFPKPMYRYLLNQLHDSIGRASSHWNNNSCMLSDGKIKKGTAPDDHHMVSRQVMVSIGGGQYPLLFGPVITDDKMKYLDRDDAGMNTRSFDCFCQIEKSGFVDFWDKVKHVFTTIEYGATGYNIGRGKSKYSEINDELTMPWYGGGTIAGLTLATIGGFASGVDPLVALGLQGMGGLAGLFFAAPLIRDYAKRTPLIGSYLSFLMGDKRRVLYKKKGKNHKLTDRYISHSTGEITLPRDMNR